MAEVPIEQGPPSPDQLPKGAAKDLNAGQALAQQAQAQNPPLKIQPPNPADHGPVPVGPDDSALFGPPSQAEAGRTGPAVMPSQAPPPNMAQILPTLVAVAKQPDAPPQIKALLSILMTQMGTK